MEPWVPQSPVNNIFVEAAKLIKKKTTCSFLTFYCSKQHAWTQRTGKQFYFWCEEGYFASRWFKWCPEVPQPLAPPIWAARFPPEEQLCLPQRGQGAWTVGLQLPLSAPQAPTHYGPDAVGERDVRERGSSQNCGHLWKGWCTLTCYRWLNLEDRGSNLPVHPGCLFYPLLSFILLSFMENTDLPTRYLFPFGNSFHILHPGKGLGASKRESKQAKEKEIRGEKKKKREAEEGGRERGRKEGRKEEKGREGGRKVGRQDERKEGSLA